MKGLLVRVSLLLLLIGGVVSSVTAKDEWIQVRSKNFLLIGNASERDVRNVAERLERFRSALSKLFNNADLSSPVATNVVVFRDEATYLPYKPLRRDGKIDLTVQGYFQSGTDVNYITVTIGRGEDEAYRTIFHEYVHFAVSTIYPKAEVPTWFNEGLAEYYSTFALRDARTADVGAPIKEHVKLLEKNALLPLDTLFPLRGTDVNNSSVYSRSLFYAESWAFVHYLIETGRTVELNEFIRDVLNGTPLDQAFRAAFGRDYRAMETAFKTYIDRKSYGLSHIVLGDVEGTDQGLVASRLSTTYTSAYLGDLLYRLERPVEAEKLLLSALENDRTNDIANADLGLIRFQQQKFDDARKYLEIAAANKQTSAPILYRYAYVLSREGFDRSGNSIDYEPATVEKMRAALKRAIAIGPALTESYDLIAVIALAENDSLEEAANAMQTALHYEPGRNDFALRLADIYVRQKSYGPARELAKRVAQYSAPDLKLRANAILSYIGEQEAGENPGLSELPALGPRTDPPMTRSEIDAANALSTLRSLNADLRMPKVGESRVLGTLERIECSQRRVIFTVHSQGKVLSLSSVDFQQLTLRTFDKDAPASQIGCDSHVQARTAVVTYKEPDQLVAIEFVPLDFRLLAPTEMVQLRAHLVRQDQVDSDGYSLKDRAPSPQNISAADTSRGSILGPIADGEKRGIGYLQAIECGDEFYVVVRTSTGRLHLQNLSRHALHLASFVPEMPAADLTCSSKLTDYPVVITYKPSAAGSGTIVSLAVVPRDFKLD